MQTFDVFVDALSESKKLEKRIPGLTRNALHD
jgi:hypothetical protein